MRTSTNAIKAKLDAILSDYMSADQQIEAGMHNDPDFFDSYRYHDLTNKKAMLLHAHHKLTDALVAIEQYM